MLKIKKVKTIGYMFMKKFRFVLRHIKDHSFASLF